MNGTKVVIRRKENAKARKILYFMGVPRQYHLYLVLKDDFEFCPEPMDNDNEIILEDYKNVVVEMTPIQIGTTHMRKLDYAKQVLGKAPDKTEQPDRELQLNKYIWHNVLAHKSTELINAIGGFARDGKYILFEEEKADGSILVG